MKDVLNVNFAEEENTSAEIYNQNGALVKRAEMLSDNTLIHVNDLPGGVYILKVSNKELSISKKFVKE